MNTLKIHPYAATFVISGAALALFLLLTNPANVSVGVLVVPVVLFFLMMFSLVHTLIYKLDMWRGNLAKKRMAALAGATFITVVAILQSSGGVSLADVILLSLIFLLTSLYISRF